MARLHAGQLSVERSEDTERYRRKVTAARSGKGRSAFGAELARAVERRVAPTADDRAGGPGRGLGDGLPHGLPHRDPRADADARAGRSARRRRGGNRLAYLELRIAGQIADDAHPDALVQALLQLVRQRDVLDLESLERQPEIGERRLRL